LRSLGGTIAPGGSFWDPAREVDVPLLSVANPGAEYDAGRAESFVARFHWVRFGGVALPPIYLYVGGTLFWDFGPDWDSAEVVGAFFDLLAALERECDITLAFDDEDHHVEVGPSFEAMYREWHAR
jgi:hypothetical protein